MTDRDTLIVKATLERAAKAASRSLQKEASGYVDENEALLLRSERENRLTVVSAIRALASNPAEITAILADVPEVSVKPLEWMDAGFDQDADLVDTTQTYQIQEGIFWYAAETTGVHCGDNESAKAAAQADYARRVRECLAYGGEGK